MSSKRGPLDAFFKPLPNKKAKPDAKRLQVG
jgi:hypothetical protein